MDVLQHVKVIIYDSALFNSVYFPDTFPIVLIDNSNKPSDVQKDGLHKLVKISLRFSGLAIVFTHGPGTRPDPYKIPIPSLDGMFPGSGTVSGIFSLI